MTTSDFAQLQRLINAAGLLERRPGYYAVRLTAVALALVAGWARLLLARDRPPARARPIEAAS